MLSELFIENYILIPKLSIRFQTGFNAITGETGAGKSILLGALSLILGQRAESQVLLEPSRKCVIEGVFTATNQSVSAFLKENDLDENVQVIIRREITPGGKSRAFINDTPVQLAQLKELGDLLVDVHSQHSMLYLNESAFQLSVIDHFAGNGKSLVQYRQTYDEYQSLLRRRNRLAEEEKRQAAEADFLKFQWDELDTARLVPDEQSELETELETLTHAEEIKGRLHHVSEGLVNGEETIVAGLGSMTGIMKHVSVLFQPALPLLKRLEECAIELDDIGAELTTLTEKINYDPDRIVAVQERLDLIYRLEHKHRENTVAGLCSIRDSLAAQLEAIVSTGDELSLTEKQLNQCRDLLLRQSDELSRNRRKSFPAFTKAVLANLLEIGMANARLVVDHQSLAEPSENGSDRIVFLFNANPDGDLRPVAKIASGGELSRLMLAIKAVLSKQSLVATIIFDEIDTGVSGEIASRLGQVMQRMGEGIQLIAITHLPQIAAKASTHFKVFKTTGDGVTRTSITELSHDERIDELAGMLGGTTAKTEARTTAKQLMN